MTEVWKSLPRHFCKFCLCWIADNKPSRDFHEQGKKHNENVKLKIGEAHRKGRDKVEKDAKFKQSLRHMEQAALKALEEDVKRDPSLAAQYGITLATQEKSTIEELKSDKSPVGEGGGSEADEPVDEDRVCAKQQEEQKEEEEVCQWKTTRSPEGYTYYWHTQTGEVTWTKPKDYKPVAPAFLQSVVEPSTLVKSSGQGKERKESEAKVPIKKSEQKEQNATDKMPQANVAHCSSSSEHACTIGPQPRACAYGSWQSTEVQEPEVVDLELPEVQKPQQVKTITVSEAKIKFKEKTAPSPKAGEFIAFKRRKFNKGSFSFRKKDES